MNAERTQAYGRIVRTLEEIGPVKLLHTELARIREAADTLIFASDVEDDARVAIDDIRALADHLVESGRWSYERATALVDDVSACGPLLAPVA
jgi:hypothetical protein